MKMISKSLILGALSLMMAFAPVKKASAGIVITNGFVAGTGIFLVVPGLFMSSEVADGFGLTLLVGGIALIVLDDNQQNLDQTLAKEFSGIPSYVLKEAAFLANKKSKESKFDKNGIKQVVLSEEEFDSLAEAIPSSVNPSEYSKFRSLMTEMIQL